MYNYAITQLHYYLQMSSVLKENNFLEHELNTQPPDIRLQYLEQNGYNISYLKNTTYVERLTAVSNCGSALQFIEEQYQTPYIVKIALKNNPCALQYVKNKTGSCCLLALKIIEEQVYGMRRNIQQISFSVVFSMIKNWDYKDKDYIACLELSEKYD